MKRIYVKPALEVYDYLAEEGYATTVALHRDYVLIEGNDHSTTRASEEITDITDADGEYTASSWETWK